MSTGGAIKMKQNPLFNIDHPMYLEGGQRV
jgi:hypothetical protein